jgi:hypothetical protein
MVGGCGGIIETGIWNLDLSLAVASCFETKIMRAGRVAFGKVESF